MTLVKLVFFFVLFGFSFSVTIYIRNTRTILIFVILKSRGVCVCACHSITYGCQKTTCGVGCGSSGTELSLSGFVALPYPLSHLTSPTAVVCE